MRIDVWLFHVAMAEQNIPIMTIGEQTIRAALAPPSQLPEWQWWERHIELDSSSNAPGKYSTALVPMARSFCQWRENPRVRRIVLMVSAQSTKTTLGLNSICHDVTEEPATAMWVMASAEHVKEFYHKRIKPSLENCKLTRDWFDKRRVKLKKSLVQFDSMNLILRGSNSRIGLQSDPVRRLYLDERREWKKGAIELVRKRTRTFHNFLEVSMGTAGRVNDELHLDFKDGSQTFFHWNCPTCDHSQPFRFSQKASPLWPKARARGGLVCPADDKTKPNGEWDWDAVREATRYECEHCGRLFHNDEKVTLLASLHEVHRNPEALKGKAGAYVSLHWNTLYMSFPDCHWGEIMVRFLKAVKAMRFGNIEPMIAFITEDLGEPWEERGERPKEDDLRKQCGMNHGQPYNRGQKWVESPDICDLLTFDKQAGQGGFVKWVWCQWTRTANSKLVDYGTCLDLDELRVLQKDKFKIRSENVWGDSGWDAPTVYAACVMWGWGALKSGGEKVRSFTSYENRTPISRPWKWGETDPAKGKVGAGRVTLPLLHWSDPAYMDRLLLFIALGRGPLWLLPDDVGEDFLNELRGRERRTVKNEHGVESHYWHKLHSDDWLKCMCMQLAVADAEGIAVAGWQTEGK